MLALFASRYDSLSGATELVFEDSGHSPTADSSSPDGGRLRVIMRSILYSPWLSDRYPARRSWTDPGSRSLSIS